MKDEEAVRYYSNTRVQYRRLRPGGHSFHMTESARRLIETKKRMLRTATKRGDNFVTNRRTTPPHRLTPPSKSAKITAVRIALGAEAGSYELRKELPHLRTSLHPMALNRPARPSRSQLYRAFGRLQRYQPPMSPPPSSHIASPRQYFFRFPAQHHTVPCNMSLNCAIWVRKC